MAKKKAATSRKKTPADDTDGLQLAKSELGGLKLTPRHRLFVLEYLKDFDRSRAYRAVYGENKASSTWAAASRLLRNVKVQELVAKETDAVLSGTRDELRQYFERHVLEVLSARAGDYVDENGQIDLEKLRTVNPTAVASLDIQSGPDGTRARIRLRETGTALQLASRVLGYLEPDQRSNNVIIVRSTGLKF